MEYPFLSSQLTINSLKDHDFLVYDIHAPYMIILESCYQGDENFHIFQFSPQSYTRSDLSGPLRERLKNGPLHRHSCIEIMYVLSGAVTNRVENQIFTYEAGQCCVMNKNIRHKEVYDGEYQAVFFMLRDDYLLEMQKEDKECHLGDEMENAVYQLAEDGLKETLQFEKVYLDYFPMIPAGQILEKLSPIFNYIIQESIGRKAGSSFLIKGLFARFLQILSDPNLFCIHRIRSDSDNQEYLFGKIDHVMKTSHGRCTRESLSAQLHYHGEYLNRIMKKYTGQTILEYGRSIYMEEARKMLVETDKSISDIIASLGFSNRSHFYRLFREKYRETPLEYRANHRKTNPSGENES